MRIQIFFLSVVLLVGLSGYYLGQQMVQKSVKLDAPVSVAVPVTSHDFNQFRRANFPRRPLKPKDLKFCAKTGIAQLKYGWTCAGDPTCESCYRDKNWRPMVDGANSIDFSKFNFTGSRTVVVAAVNYGQIYLVANWLCSCEANNVPDPREYTLMVPTDRQAHEYLVSTLGFKSVDPGWLASVHIDSRYRGTANTHGHSSINNAVLIVGAKVMNRWRGSNVLIHDVDQVWINGGPLEYLERVSSTGMVDMFGMESPYDTAKGGFNSGFLYFVNNEYSRIFMETLVNIAQIKDNSDQAMINSVIRHRRFIHNYIVAPLPTELFVREGGSRGPKVRPGLSLVYHAVSTKKKEKFERNGQWFFNSTVCPKYYNRDIIGTEHI